MPTAVARPAPLAALLATIPLLAALPGCPDPVQRIVVQEGDTVVQDGDTNVTVEASDCCCCASDCCEDPCDDTGGGGGDGSDGGDDGDDGGDDGAEPGVCDHLDAPTPYDIGAREDCQLDGADAPDLFFLEGASWCFDCDEEQVTIYLIVGNQGMADAGPTELAFTVGGGEVARFSVDPVPSGQSVVVGPMVLDTNSWSGTLDATVDVDDLEAECDEANNLASVMGITWDNACE